MYDVIPLSQHDKLVPTQETTLRLSINSTVATTTTSIKGHASVLYSVYPIGKVFGWQYVLRSIINY